ncbi:DUF2240 family protein [Haloarchaeobius sp. TZWWS8]|uniref:DUF2240 family protein n=1 Tax=Haloarchaeobius sp. TZWWS8 TaxID=3446121 RepID=UPI003EB6FC57
MSLRVAVAAPFRQRGKRELAENEFVVALSLDRDWFSPDQAKRLVDVATGEGLLEREENTLRCTFEPSEVEIPEDFVPGDDVLRSRSAFEQVLDDLVADGHEKHEVVGAINQLQQELDVTIAAAALVYARKQGIDVSEVRGKAVAELRGEEAV